MTRRLYLVRHASVAVPPGICYGRSDVALAEPVAKQLAWLKSVLPSASSALPIFTSPLSRCLLLAQALSDANDVVIDERLAEMDFGEWEMQRFNDIPRAQIDAWASDPLGFHPPGGESGDEVMARVTTALTEILARDADALIVSHGGPLRAICGSLLGLPREVWLTQDIALGSLTVLSREENQWRVGA